MNEPPLAPEDLDPVSRGEYEAALGLFTKQRHCFRASFRSADGVDNPLAERHGRADDFRRMVRDILEMRPSAVILEVVPFYNGKGPKPGYREFRLKLPRSSAGLGAVDRYGFAPPETRPGPGLELRLMEQEHRFSALLGDQRHQFEQEALKRRIEDLEREVKTREKEVEILEYRLEEAAEDYAAKLHSLANMAKVGGQSLGGLLTGVVAHFRPELAETVGSQIDGILHGLTGIAANKALPGGGGTDAGYEDYDGEGASVVGLSDQAYIHLDTLGEDALPQLELLIGQVARQPDPAMRKWLLSSLNETLAGLLAPRTEEQLF